MRTEARAERRDRAGGELSFDPERARRHLRARDRDLGALIREVGPLRIEVAASASAFAALAEAIVYQQLTGKAAATIFGRLGSLCGVSKKRALSPRSVLEAGEEELRRAGLSRNKMLAIRDLAAKTLDGTVPSLAALRRMDDEEVIAALTAVRGVGRWTAEMFLIFRLGRPDVLPLGDYGVRKGFAAAFGLDELPKPADLAARGERWRPFRTAASWYLWRAAERGAAGGA